MDGGLSLNKNGGGCLAGIKINQRWALTQCIVAYNNKLKTVGGHTWEYTFTEKLQYNNYG